MSFANEMTNSKEEARLARNEKQRERRAIEKQYKAWLMSDERKAESARYAEIKKRREEMENSEEWKTMKAEMKLLDEERHKKNDILQKEIWRIQEEIHANSITQHRLEEANMKILEEKFGL